MPYPLAHFLVGAAVAEVALPPDLARRTRLVALAGLCSLLPDLDFVPIVLMGADASIHRGPTHSLVAALCLTAASFGFRTRSRRRIMLAAGFSLASHGLLDALTTLRGQGVMLFWPLSSARMCYPLTLMFETSLGRPLATIVWRSAVEAVYFSPVYCLSWLWASRRARMGAVAIGDGSGDATSSTRSRWSRDS